MDTSQLNRELEAENYTLPLKPIHREAMLDLVLAWGTLDGVLGMLLAKFLNLPLHEAADEIGKQNGSAKLAEVIKIISQVEAGKNFSKLLRKHKKTYEKYSKPRNKIAHGHCPGYLLCDEITSCLPFSSEWREARTWPQMRFLSKKWNEQRSGAECSPYG